jgi:signal transduction histidine kinase
MMTEQNDLHFKTNVQLKSIIGKDLINDDNIAILELVKNSFDADAKQVKVEYYNLKDNDDYIDNFSELTSRLIIQDDGTGMDIEDIKHKWLNIAYSEKKLNKTQHKRRMAGAKGVGRFSCDRLGEYLNLYSKTSKDTHYYKLSIDWKKFEIEDEDKEIQSIPLKYEILSINEFEKLGFTNFDHGVLLEIIKLRSNWAYQIIDKNGIVTKWDVSKFVELKKYLEKLINPNQAFESNDFGVYIDAPEFINENNLLDDYSKFIGKVENRIFEHLDFKTTSVETVITDNGNELYTELKDKGETIFWIREKNPFSPHITNAKATVYYLSPYAKSFFTKQTGIRSVDYGSIFLFINGFRVPPYGELGNDWLGLDQRKAQGHSRYIGLRELVGQIEILDEENEFQIVSSREGIVKNESFKNLTYSENNNSFFYKAFRRLERYVVEGLNWDRAAEDEDLHNIHKKIVSGETKEEDLEYLEDSITKQKRIYSTIHNIISAKSNDVIELYINENLITQKIEEEREVSEREFNQLIEDFSNKKIDSDTLSKILQRKADENQELERQLKEFSKYTTNEATSKAILELQHYKNTIEQQTYLIQELQVQLEELKEQKESAEKTATTYKEKVIKVEADLTIEKEKNLYLLATRRTLSPDADGLIHTIKINNIDIRDGIENIIDDLIEGEFETNEIIKKLGYLKLSAERSLKMSEFITRNDLTSDIETIDVDIVKYINEYVNLYGDVFSDKLKFEFKNNDVYLNKSLSVLNMSIIIDNLISNSVKWGANKIQFEFNKVSENQIVLYISDDGVGLSKKFENNPEKIFELSVRDNPPTGLSGSGIGLFYTKNLLNEMRCDIEYFGNGVKLSGATFKITFNSL